MKKVINILFMLFLMQSATYAQVLPDGSLVKSFESDEIYLVFDQELHQIPNMTIFKSLFIKNVKADVYKKIDLEILPKGAPLTNARLIKGSSSAVYLQYKNVKIHIGSEDTFNQLQFNWNSIVTITDKELYKYTTLKPLYLTAKQKEEKLHFECGTK